VEYLYRDDGENKIVDALVEGGWERENINKSS
jgi:hypothetical protein